MKGTCKNGNDCMFAHFPKEMVEELARAKAKAKAKAAGKAKAKAKAAAAAPNAVAATAVPIGAAVPQ